MNPANIVDNTMESPSQLSTAQGREYDSIHKGQHGGAALVGAPVGSTGVLDSSLRDIARVSPIDQAVAGIQGMKDQSGGRRSRKSRRSKKSKKSRRSKRSRRQRGGSHSVNPADYNSPGALLPPAMEAKALMGMNPEWKLAENPNSFAPRLS